MFVKAKDQVVVISGKDKGAKGKVVAAAPKTGKVVVENVAMVTKHQKPKQQGQPGGIIKKEAFIDASNVMVICPKCGQPTRIGHVFIEGEGKASRRKRRVCKKCKAVFDNRC